MTTTAEEVLKEALQLSEVERARVAAELLASLEPDVETRDSEAWIAEVERRAQRVVLARLRPARRRARRQRRPRALGSMVLESALALDPNWTQLDGAVPASY
ncbi:MAG: hypothetical protein DMF79_09245 [Acidobacteria bacterium]|nr:MAG: hypothetical protein DMF79_09245 [Acidobacteriota bacterium]